MIDTKFFRTVVDTVNDTTSLKQIANSILDEYDALDKEYSDLEMQKAEIFMPAIEGIILSKTVDEDIQALKRVVSSLKTNYVKCLEELKKLKSQN